MGVVMTAAAIERIERIDQRIDRARVEVARVRGWTSRGAHDRAAQALDAALRAVADADAALHATPCAAVAACLTTIRLDLDRLTRGA